MARKKSAFYHARIKAGLNEERAAELLGVPTSTVIEYDHSGAPTMAEKLVTLWDRKYVGHEGWEGFLFSRGALLYKRRRWTPAMILRATEQDDEIRALQSEIARLNTWRGLFTKTVEKLVDELPGNSKKSRFQSFRPKIRQF